MKSDFFIKSFEKVSKPNHTFRVKATVFRTVVTFDFIFEDEDENEDDVV